LRGHDKAGLRNAMVALKGADIDRFVVRPFGDAFRWCDRMERSWTDFLSGAASRESDRVAPVAPTEEKA